MNDISCLFPHFDAFGWVPTIRGALSLDLFNSRNNALGDVDRFSSEFGYYQGQAHVYYLAASSLDTIVDRKLKGDYTRTYRFFFDGVINNIDREYRILAEDCLGRNNDAVRLLGKEAFLIGKLTIVPERTDEVSPCEVEALKCLKLLDKSRDEYRQVYHIKNEPFEDIEPKRDDMLRGWEAYRDSVRKVAVEKAQTNVYEFEILMTRCGIILIKDFTAPESQQSYRKPGGIDDYKIHIPLPRIFKYAMNYVKFLFHSNYHHHDTHDTFLPASNINPCIADGKIEFERIFKHQYSSLIDPLVKLKRKEFKDYSIDPAGVALYARAFLNVCHDRGLITDACYNERSRFLEIQDKEIEHMTQQKRSVINTILSQSNLIFIISGVLAIVVGVLKIATTALTLPSYHISEPKNPDNEDAFSVIIGLISLVVVVTVVFLCVQYSNNTKRYIRKHSNSWRRRLLCRDSDLKKGRISKWYALYIQLKMINARKRIVQWLKFWISSAIVLLGAALMYLLR